jgi:hypothetical protein
MKAAGPLRSGDTEAIVATEESISNIGPDGVYAVYLRLGSGDMREL